jgi:sporulation protein YlmC with PRC-barrel domain
MCEEVFRNRNGQLLGRVKEVNMVYELRDKNGVLLGKYNPETNQTRDRNAKLLGKGNLLSMLIIDY